jgi:hypothetical protein
MTQMFDAKADLQLDESVDEALEVGLIDLLATSEGCAGDQGQKPTLEAHSTVQLVVRDNRRSWSTRNAGNIKPSGKGALPVVRSHHVITSIPMALA